MKEIKEVEREKRNKWGWEDRNTYREKGKLRERRRKVNAKQRYIEIDIDEEPGEIWRKNTN